jgi:hypothetical protein
LTLVASECSSGGSTAAWPWALIPVKGAGNKGRSIQEREQRMMRNQHWVFRRLLLSALAFVILVGPSLFPIHVQAQDEPVTVVASGLTNPRGIAWDAEGTLHVALAGIGGEPEAMGTPAAPGSSTSGIALIENGCGVEFASGQPSGELTDMGWVFGVSEIAFVDGALYMLVDGGGVAWDNADQPNGLYKITESGDAEMIVDLGAWLAENPVETQYEPINPSGEWFDMVVGDGVFWITEANHQQLITVTLDGEVTRVADFSSHGNVAPTGVVIAPDGGVYVAFLSAVPFTDGSSKVVHVSPDGEVTDHWTGLTAVTALALDAEGRLYALEMATRNTAEPPFTHSGTGRLVRQTGPDASDVLVTGLDLPVKLEFDPGGALYVVAPSFGANAGEGYILRIDLSGDQPIAIPEDLDTASACAS